MYLKNIKAFGFKSFADKVNIEVKDGITGVVGPNGSGKSNIVDAVRWVLGEQSVKALRGESGMNDVIFSGSKSRPQANRSVVALTFDNSDHYLNSEFSELEIKRVLYRNGDNEYYINNAKVRLKDVTDLFMDSGAGKESFNIISQGAVTDIVNDKPIERRVIFEEAAGVLKYKKRKEDTLKKLAKAKDNLEKVSLLIQELDGQVKPLAKQAEAANKYLKYNAELKNTEITLIANDIKEMNINYKELNDEKDNITAFIDNMNLTNNKELANLEKLKLEKIKIEEKITIDSDLLVQFEKNIAELDAKKQLATERKKYEVDDLKLENNIISLKEDTLNINKNINTLTSELNNLKIELQSKIKIKNEFDDEILNLTHKHYSLEGLINSKNKEILECKNKLDIINNNIEENATVPYAVKVILNNPRFKGIHGTLGNLISTDEKYTLAISTALGANNNVVVVDNPNDAKECINYLKENRYGRATFFPLSVIKSRYVDLNTLKLINNEDGFINTADNLVDYDDKYSDVVKNQLGNIIVVDNIDAMNKIGKIIEYKYRIITLDGEVLFAGGAITGGTLKKDNSLIKLKQDALKLNEMIDSLNLEVKKYTKDLNILLNDEKEKNEFVHNQMAEIIDLTEKVNRKNISLMDLQKSFSSKQQELDSTNNVKNNDIDSEINALLEEYYKKIADKDILLQEMKKYKDELDNVTLKINDYEENNKKINSEYNKNQNVLKEIEIKLGKMDVKLDNYLNILNENYNITYNLALEQSDPNIDMNDAREKVSNLKQLIKQLGDVNIGSIQEYDRVNTRYTFLVTQQEDLNSSTNELLNIIDDMDKIMVTKFKDSFNMIAANFGDVFKTLFKGGIGKLVLTDPDNILETGVDIIAEPPGKKLNSIVLLSGGEKTLTAIALLFAILKTKPVPFVILDEVEAALDDANVDTFGKYLEMQKENSQFIIITHKKKTMEYADTLYGITMQESGVSKLVSVKLED